MTTLNTITLEVADVAAAQAFYDAFGTGPQVNLRATDDASTGFRGFTLSLVCAQPGNVDAFVDAGIAAGATVLKPAKKNLWGYGAVLQAPDGTIWKIATSAKKDKAPVAREFDDLVLLLGVEDVKATKQFYVDRGLPVGKSFGGKYVEFETSGSAVKLALYPRKAAAKDAGVPVEGSGSHRVVVGGELGAFTDPDGFVWEDASCP
jgi:predicted lactoylglutathione lyase